MQQQSSMPNTNGSDSSTNQHSRSMYLISGVIVLIAILTLYALGIDSNTPERSLWDHTFEFTCAKSSSITACALVFGLIENAIFFGLIFTLYRIWIYYHWKWRYQSDISDLIVELTKLDEQQGEPIFADVFTVNPSKKIRPVEESTKNMGYKIDPFVLLFPWLCSPILKWNAMSNFLIHCSFYITFWNLPNLESAAPLTSSESLEDIQDKSNSNILDLHFLELNWPKMVNPFESGYTNLTLEYAVFRTFSNFLIFLLPWQH